MDDGRRPDPEARGNATLDDAHHLPDDGEHGGPPEEASEPETSAPGDDDGWLPV